MEKIRKFIEAVKISYTYPAADEEDAEAADPADAKREKTAEPVPVPALSDVSLDVEAGQFICILGSNGSGKSTLARHLNALLVPDEGTVWIDGTESRDESRLWDIRAAVGMVFQNPDNQIIASVVDEDVAFGPENVGVPSEEIRERVKGVLKETGMEKHAKSSPNRLSGGQKQRVAVAGVLAMRPKCIVLDESTAMLDPKGRKEVMDTVLWLNREKGLTVIAITHYMDEAIGADRIFVMDKGKVVMSGTPKEIFSRPDVIKKAGLCLPPVCALAEELRNRGLDIPADVITAKDLRCALRKIRSTQTC